MSRIVSAALLVLVLACCARAEDPQADLRRLRDGVVAALRARDVNALERLLHPEVVVTWQHNIVARKPAGVRAALAAMQAPDAPVRDARCELKLDGDPVLVGRETAVAAGTLDDRYTFRDGSEFALHSRWSATLVKLDDGWVVAAAHASASPFENGFLDLVVRKASWMTGGIALLVGTLLGIAIGWAINRQL